MLVSRLGRILGIVLLAFTPACGGSDSDSGESKHSKTIPVLSLQRLRNLGKVHAERDSEEGYLEAAQSLAEVVERSPEDGMDHLNLARVLLYLDSRIEEVGPHLEAARRLLGADAPPALEDVTGLYARRMRDLPTAIGAFTRLTERVPEHAHGWYQRGRCEADLGRFEDAQTSFERALQIEPGLRAAAYHSFMALQRLERAEEAEAARQRFEAISSEIAEDTDKCELTRVTLDRSRAASEPASVTFEWRERDEDLLADGGGTLLAVIDADGRDALLIQTERGFELARGDARSLRLEGASVSPEAPRVAVGDVDNDGELDGIWVSPGGELQVAFDLLDDAVMLGEPVPLDQGVAQVSLFDLDHDGDLDVIGGARSALRWVRNDGDRSFTLMQPPLYQSESELLTFDVHDLDRGNDLDIVVADALVRVLLNRRDGTFSPVDLPSLESAVRVLVEDFDNDGAPDVLAFRATGEWACAFNAGEGRPGSVAFRDTESVRFAAGEGSLRDVRSGDLDNDGDLDVLVAHDTGISLLRNTRGGRFVLESVADLPPSRLALADLDGDGLLEVIAQGDQLHIFSSGATPHYGSWRVRPEGKKDNREAIGAIVEQWAGPIYSSSMIKEPGGLRLGLGAQDRGEIEGIKVRWPQGILQAVPTADLEIAANGSARFPQKEGLVASCPFLYARGPEGWAFLTDVIGIAPLDEWLPPGATAHLDPEEYVRIDGARLEAVDGQLHLAITEELRETTYLDRVELVAVDHPSDGNLYLDESTRRDRYESLAGYLVPEKDVTAVDGLQLPDGRDESELVASRDGRYVHGYPDVPPQLSGWVERYDLELTLGAPATHLLLTGRIAWYDSTVAYSLWQQDRTWGPLRIEEIQGDRRHVLAADVGVPAGMDRTMVVELSKPLPPGARLAISGQHRFLWDTIASARNVSRFSLPTEGAATSESGQALVRHVVQLEQATLEFHGFSRTEGNVARHEQTYAFEESAPDDWLPRARGIATRYGRVEELLDAHDDRLVVLVAGDRVRLDFKAPPEPATGLRRTWFLRLSGWAKEGSFHNRTGRWILPLPYCAMKSYPPEEPRPMDPEYRRYLEQYQTRAIR